MKLSASELKALNSYKDEPQFSNIPEWFHLVSKGLIQRRSSGPVHEITDEGRKVLKEYADAHS